MAGPFLALVGCIITIALAVKHFGNEAITDGGVRQGLVVKRIGMPEAGGAPAGQQPSEATGGSSRTGG